MCKWDERSMIEADKANILRRMATNTMTRKTILVLVVSSSGELQNGLLALTTTIPGISAVLVAPPSTPMRTVSSGVLKWVMRLEAIPKPEVTLAIVILGHQQGASTGNWAGSLDGLRRRGFMPRLRTTSRHKAVRQAHNRPLLQQTQ